MSAKVFILLLVIGLSLNAEVRGKAALRRKPKIYNALITTDENLVQSRAYPVIQPTIHEPAMTHYPFGPYHPYGIYTPPVVRYGQPIVPGLASKEQLPYPLPIGQFPPQIMRQPLHPQPAPFSGYPQPVPPFAGYPLPQAPPTGPAMEMKPEDMPTKTPPTVLSEQPAEAPALSPTMLMPKAIKATQPDPNQPEKMPKEQLPIPLNEYGLPPSLIPLRHPGYPPSPYHHHPRQAHVHLPPYAFNQFPPLYINPVTGLRQPYLPPYDYLPTGPHFDISNTIPTDKKYSAFPAVPQYPPPAPQPTSAPALPPQPSATTTTNLEEVTEQSTLAFDSTDPEPSFENIKNGSKSSDSSVPDVPPPPIPSGAKSKQSEIQ